MRCVVLLSLLAVVYSAPAGEAPVANEIAEVQQDDIRVKRAKEIMMFGNQQNERTDKEKRDANSVEEDENGEIIASVDDKSDVIDEQIESDMESVDNDAESQSIEGDESMPVQLGGQESEQSDETAIVNANNPFEDDDYLKELQQTGLANSNDENEILFKDLQSLQSVYPGLFGPQYNNKNWQPNNRMSYKPYIRFRRSQMRSVPGKQALLPRVLKRSRRIKRDLMLPDGAYSQGYYPYDDMYENLPYNNLPIEDNEDISYLLDLLDGAREYNDDIDEDAYGTDMLYGYSPYQETEDLRYPDEAAYTMPKRQASLGFVPGFKRSQGFFPYFEEPETHFPAFVPQKRSMRDYADAYERLMQLGSALNARDNSYSGPYGYEYDFRKK